MKEKGGASVRDTCEPPPDCPSLPLIVILRSAATKDPPIDMRLPPERNARGLGDPSLALRMTAGGEAHLCARCRRPAFPSQCPRAGALVEKETRLNDSNSLHDVFLRSVAKDPGAP